RAREDRRCIYARRLDHERKCCLEVHLAGLRQRIPCAGILQVAVGADAQQAARIIERLALIAGVADADRSFVQQQPNRTGLIDVDVEDGAAHGYRGYRSADRVERLGGNAGDEAKAALDEVEDDRAARFVGIIDETVERHSRAGPDGQLRLIAQHHLRDRVGARCDDLFLDDVIAGGELAKVLAELARHLIDDSHRRADSITWIGECRRGRRYEKKAEKEAPYIHDRKRHSAAGITRKITRTNLVLKVL